MLASHCSIVNIDDRNLEKLFTQERQTGIILTRHNPVWSFEIIGLKQYSYSDPSIYSRENRNMNNILYQNTHYNITSYSTNVL